jgi:hypothetical protein
VAATTEPAQRQQLVKHWGQKVQLADLAHSVGAEERQPEAMRLWNLASSGRTGCRNRHEHQPRAAAATRVGRESPLVSQRSSIRRPCLTEASASGYGWLAGGGVRFGSGGFPPAVVGRPRPRKEKDDHLHLRPVLPHFGEVPTWNPFGWALSKTPWGPAQTAGHLLEVTGSSPYYTATNPRATARVRS